MIGKDRIAESDAAHIFINDLAGSEEPHMNRVEMGIVKTPKFDAVELRKRYRVARWILDCLRRAVNGSISIRIERSLRRSCRAAGASN